MGVLPSRFSPLEPRVLRWEGCLNVRDLGGLPTLDGRATRFHGVVRSASPAGLTPSGEAALYDYGIRTVIDLRCNGEGERPKLCRDIEVIQLPVLDFSEEKFWAPIQRAHPVEMYRAVLVHWAPRFCGVVAAVAEAKDGGVLLHCEAGRDRTGLVCALVLQLAGVTDESIAQDYAMSAPQLEFEYKLLALESKLRLCFDTKQRNFSEKAWMYRIMQEIDVGRYCLEGGVSTDTLASVKSRLLGKG